MLPVFFNLGPIPVRSYGVLLVIGVLVALAIAKRRAPLFGISPEKVWESSMWLVLPGVLGARVTYVVQHIDYYRVHQDQLWSLRFEGLTSFGGILFGFIGFLVWRKLSKVSTLGFLDTVGVPILVAQAIGRIGCLTNGCCYGRPTHDWYGVVQGSLPDKHVPAQLIDFAGMLLGALAVTLIERRKTLRPGASFGWSFVAYGISRFIYEIFRAGTADEFAQGIASSAYIKGTMVTSAQVASLAFSLIGLLFIIISRRSNTSVKPN
ncbi:MAG: prolipoprotein diacylglyceryl transferase [Chthonomonadaceae bacterium]|nr:prolipoprotein diacylglyceryl transferase [Chthonomonadaceae bacterium]